MTADVLREAAALMRQRAEAIGFPDGNDMNASWAEGCRSDLRGEDADHAATFGHPAVALAVADWLDSHASAHIVHDPRAVAVANAYLGRDA